MVGFLRKKKSDKVLLGDETVLERKGRVDGASLLDEDGEATHGTLYNQNKLPLKKGGRKNSDEENTAPQNQPAPQYPPANYPYGQTYPPQNGFGYPQQQQQPVGAFGKPATGFGSSGSFNSRGNFGQSAQAPPQQQYPVQYGASQPQYGNNQPQYGNNQPQYGNNQPQYGSQQPQYGSQPQYGNQPQQYPVQYGNYPPPPQPTQKKSSFFRIPGYGKK